MAKATTVISIKPANLQTFEAKIIGTAPYVQHKFSEKAKRQMLEAQQSTKAKSRKAKEPRDIEEDYLGAIHLDHDGRYGIPAPAFRSACISACRVAGFQMTKAKLSIFIEADSFDRDDGTGLVHIDGEPKMHQAAVRLESGVASISVRPMWNPGWTAVVRVRYDADQFSQEDVANLIERAGQQVGVGEGRPDSKKSHGMGWGTFALVRG